MKLILEDGVVKLTGQTPRMKVDAELRLPSTPFSAAFPKKYERTVTREETEVLASELFKALANMMLRGGHTG